MMKRMETSRLLVLLHAFMITSLPMFESRRFFDNLGRRLLLCVVARCRCLLTRLNFLQCLCRFMGLKSVLKLVYILVIHHWLLHWSFQNQVDVKYGLAADTLRSLILNGEACSYDFAFVDADKRMYPEYFELLLQLVRIGGLIVFDNVLWHGKVADPEVNDAKTVSIRNFNADIMEDERVSISMVPIGDGMTICRKR